MTVEKKLECVKLLVESIEIPDKMKTRWGTGVQSAKNAG